MSIKRRILNYLNSDDSIDIIMVIAFAITIAICAVGIHHEKSKSENCEKAHYSTTVKDRAHGGFGYGFGYSLRTHRFGFGFGTGGINFH